MLLWRRFHPLLHTTLFLGHRGLHFPHFSFLSMHQIEMKCFRNIAIHYLSQGWLLSTLIHWLISFSRIVFFSTHRLCHQLLMLAEWHFGPQPFSRHQCTTSSDSLGVWRGVDAPNINMTTSSGFLSISYCAESIYIFSFIIARQRSDSHIPSGTVRENLFKERISNKSL